MGQRVTFTECFGDALSAAPEVTSFDSGDPPSFGTSGGVDLSGYEPTAGHATTRGAVDPSSMPRSSAPSPASIFRPTAFLPVGRIRSRGRSRARRPGPCRASGSRRSRSGSPSSSRARSPGSLADDPPPRPQIAALAAFEKGGSR